MDGSDGGYINLAHTNREYKVLETSKEQMNWWLEEQDNA